MILKSIIKFFVTLQFCFTSISYASLKKDCAYKLKFIKRREKKGLEGDKTFLEAVNSKGEILARITCNNKHSVIRSSKNNEAMRKLKKHFFGRTKRNTESSD